MAIINTTVKFSETSTGLPITVSSNASPGTKIHTASTSNADTDYVWLWVSYDASVGYLKETSYVKVVKQSGATTVIDSVIEVKPGQKNIVEAGVYLPAGVSLYLIKQVGAGITANIVASGYIHRRTETI